MTPHTPYPIPYCLNVHPSENWAQVRRALRRHVLAVKEIVAPDRPFPLSLHIGHQTSNQLIHQNALTAFKKWLTRHDCFIAGANAFPFGPFHAAKVKESAYRPDWRSPWRVDYTRQVAWILADLLPEGSTANLTTVPGGWANDWRTPDDHKLALQNLARAAAHCRDISEITGCRIQIAIEPEPGCAWQLFDPAVEAAGPEIVWCVDTCHFAVDFKPLPLRNWRRIGRVQLSAALECQNTPAARAALEPFAEERYLHQTRAALDGEVIGAWPDLAPALAALPQLPPEAIVRIHYHMPLTWPGAGPLRSTRDNLTPALFRRAAQTFCEVETYTHRILPPSLRSATLAETIARELQWATQRYRSASSKRKTVSPGLA